MSKEIEQNELHPCPYSIAVRCNLQDPCMGCETYAKYKAGEETPRFRAEQGVKGKEPRVIGGYWWCAKCKREIPSNCVTFEELHEDCGYPVTWLDVIEDTKEVNVPVEQSNKSSQPTLKEMQECHLKSKPVEQSGILSAEEILKKLRMLFQEDPFDEMYVNDKDAILTCMREYHSQKELPEDELRKELVNKINEMKIDSEETIRLWNNDMSEHSIEARGTIMACNYLLEYLKNR